MTLVVDKKFAKDVLQAKKGVTCTKCESSNHAEYRIVNGEEVSLECKPCAQETLLDIAESNIMVKIFNSGVVDGLIEISLQ